MHIYPSAINIQRYRTRMCVFTPRYLPDDASDFLDKSFLDKPKVEKQ